MARSPSYILRFLELADRDLSHDYACFQFDQRCHPKLVEILKTPFLKDSSMSPLGVVIFRIKATRSFSTLVASSIRLVTRRAYECEYENHGNIRTSESSLEFSSFAATASQHFSYVAQITLRAQELIDNE